MLLIGEGITANGAALVVGGAGAIPAAIGPVGWFVLRIGGLATAFAAASSFDGTMAQTPVDYSFARVWRIKK
jgi:hypothetical protein